MLGHLFLLFLIINMPTNLRKSSGFGAGENFSMAKLPTYAAVGRQFLQCQSDLKAQRNKLIVPNIDVSKMVKIVILIFEKEVSLHIFKLNQCYLTSARYLGRR